MPSVMEIAMKDMGFLIDLANANMKTLPGPVVNVLGYGAKGDGKKDDTVSIQKALNYADSLGGAIVYVPDGRYIISGALLIPPNTYLKGSGMKRTIIEWDISNNVVVEMIRFADNDDTKKSCISDIALNQRRVERGLLDNQAYGGIVPINNVTIERVRIFNTAGPGITSSGLKNITIRDCEIYDTGHHGIYFSTTHAGYVKNIEITNNYIGTPADFVGRLLGANLIKFRFSTAGELLQNIKIKDNLMGSAVNEQGIFISTTSGGTSIVDNIEIYDNVINPDAVNKGMLAIIYIGTNTKGSDVAIKNNEMYGSNIVDSFGMRLLFSDIANTKNVTVSGNSVQSVETGIDGRKCTIDLNTISFSMWGIIGATGRASRNTLISSANSAVGIRQATFDMVDNEIVLSGTTTIGIDVANSTNLLVERNKITGASQGILRNAKTLTGCIISENIFIACAANYVGFTNSAVTMQNNQFERTSAIQWGATSARPTSPYPWQPYGDSTLNKPIWHNGTNWVDATGTTV